MRNREEVIGAEPDPRWGPVPQPTWLSQPFWDGTRRHELLVQHCHTCNGWEWPPQVACSTCLEESLRWEPVSGQGTIYSASTVHRPAVPTLDAPYIVAIVELDEGVRVLAPVQVVDLADGIAIGARVEVDWVDLGEITLYQFVPSA